MRSFSLLVPIGHALPGWVPRLIAQEIRAAHCRAVLKAANSELGEALEGNPWIEPRERDPAETRGGAGSGANNTSLPNGKRFLRRPPGVPPAHSPCPDIGPILASRFPKTRWQQRSAAPIPLGTKAGQLPPSAEFEDERLNLDKVGFFRLGNNAVRVPGTQRIAAGCQGGIPWKRRAVGMVAVPVSLPVPEAGKAAGFHGSSGWGFWKLDVGDESSRVSLAISGVFPTLATPLPPAPALPWLELLKGRKMSSKFWESNSRSVSCSSRLHGNGSNSHRNSPFPSRFSLWHCR